MEYATEILVVSCGVGLACAGLWLMGLEARMIRMRARIAALESVNQRMRREMSYHGFVVGCWRELLQGRSLSEEQRITLAISETPQEAAMGE